ncbi:MAG: 6-pyruvoyl trahydropterin synthase family protein [Nitrospinota bacterium]
MNSIRIKTSRADHNFAAAHFLYDMNKCERLHGHSYLLSLEIAGSPNVNGVLIDFNDLNPKVRAICNALDHFILLAKLDQRYQYNISDEEVEVLIKGRRYIFPIAEVKFLPIKATTAEYLALYLCNELKRSLVDLNDKLEWIEVGISESGSQMAICRSAFGKSNYNL